jgi:hypothetical protein
MKMRRSFEVSDLLVLGAFIALVGIPFYILPIALLASARDVVGWTLPLGLMAIPVIIVFAEDERPWAAALAGGLSGIVTLAILIDLFLQDVRVGAMLVLGFPLGVAAGWVALKLSAGMGEVGQEVTRRLLVIPVGVAANALVVGALWLWNGVRG